MGGVFNEKKRVGQHRDNWKGGKGSRGTQREIMLGDWRRWNAGVSSMVLLLLLLL